MVFGTKMLRFWALLLLYYGLNFYKLRPNSQHPEVAKRQIYNLADLCLQQIRTRLRSRYLLQYDKRGEVTLNLL